MSSLIAHLRAEEEHSKLSFHRECPRCQAERLSGGLPPPVVLPTKARAAVVAVLLAGPTVFPVASALAAVPSGAAPGAGPTSSPAPEPDPSAGPVDDDEPPGPVEADQQAEVTGLPGAGPATSPSPPPAPSSPVPGPVPAPPPDAQSPAPQQVGPSQSALPPPQPPPKPAPPAPPPMAPPAASPPSPAEGHASLPVPTHPTRKPAQRSRVAAAPIPEGGSGEDAAPGPDAQVSRGDERSNVESAPLALRTAPRATSGRHASAVRGASGVYVVQQGDCLWKIARSLLGQGSSDAAVARMVDRLWSRNAAIIRTGERDLIFPGQRLRLPRDVER